MKNNKRKLDLMIRLGVVNISDFFSIEVTKYNIAFHGKGDYNIICKYIGKGWKFDINNEGHSIAKRNNIDITFS